MKKIYLSLMLLSFVVIVGCSKKDRLTTSTMQIQIEPGSALIGAGSRQQFTATGITPKSGRVTISPIWSVDPVELGEFSVVQGDVTVFTATGSGFGTISASLSDVTDSIEIAVKDDNDTVPVDMYGVYSETDRLRLLIDVDSYIGVFSSDNATFDEDAFADITTDIKEGVYAKKSVLSVPASGSAWAGWYIQYGLMGSNDTINMTYYQSGNLKFWIKTPIDLEVGISSGVGSTKVESKLYLNSIAGFVADNEWHEISIPFLSSFSNIDWSIIKIFFLIASVSDIGGTDGETKTFYVDHIRWTEQ